MARRILDALKSFINKMRGVKDPALDSLRRAEKLMEKALDGVKRKGTPTDRQGLQYKLLVDPKADGAEQYSYDYLTSQPDMAVSKMPDQSIYAKGTGANQAKAKEDGIRNTQSTPGAVTYQGRIFVENLYTGKPIQINSQSIQHGILGSAERQRRNAAAGSIIGDLTRNAIPVNELIHAKKETQPWVEREHLFLSLAEDNTFYYPVAVVVQTSADDLGIVTHMEALEGVGKQYVYSLNAKQHKKKSRVRG